MPLPQPDLQVDPAKLAEAAYEAFLAAFWRIDARALAAAVGLLRESLESPGLESLAAREAFERRIAEAVAERALRRRTGLLFFAALQALRWSERPPLVPAGEAEGRLHRWIDAALLLDEQTRIVWLWLAEEPRHALFDAIPLTRGFDWNNAMREACCAPGELGRWHEISQVTPLGRAPSLGEWPPPARTSLRDWLAWLKSPAFLMLGAPLLTAAVVMSLLWLRGEDPNRPKPPSCADHIAAATAAHWKALSIETVELLNRCANEAPPPACEDREHLKRLNRLAAVVMQSYDGAPAGKGYLFDRNRIVLDPEDGRLLGTTGDPCDSAFRQVYQTGGWLRLGHGPTAEAIVRQGAACTLANGAMRDGPVESSMSMSTILGEWSEDTWSYKLLSRTDAWQAQAHPNGLAGVAPAPIKLASLITTDAALIAPRQENWERTAPACQPAGR